MRFNIQRPDLGKALAETEKDIERAVTSGMRDAADGLKQDLREDVVAAGLGERLSRTWRGKTFPEVGESAEAAAYVWSRAPKIVDAFDRGVVIRSGTRPVLGRPTAAAGKSGRNHVRQGWRRRTGLKLRFVYRRGRPSLLVADDARINTRGLAARNRRKTGQASVIVFILVPQPRACPR
eukprot:gene15090-15229_t